MKRPDPEDVETLSDAEQLYQVSYTDRRSTTADSDRPLQETIENASAGLPESITISSALEIVPPPDDVELPKGSPAFELGHPSFSFHTPSTPVSYSTGGFSSPVSTKAKKSKKDTKT